MLQEFLRTNREDLINRCRLKVSRRSSPPASDAELQYGVPLILDQLVEALRCEKASPSAHEASIYGLSPNTPGWIESGRTAALHGTELLGLGYTVDQVVHDYGDICQSVTELAKEIKAPITLDEFHTFNRFLDNSIAYAVSAYRRHTSGEFPYKKPLGAGDVFWRKPADSPAPWWTERYAPIEDEE